MKKTNTTLLSLGLLATLLWNGCIPSEVTDPHETEEEKLLVATSFYTLTYFTEEIAGDTVRIKQIIPEGIEPHDYELSTPELILLEQADLVIVQGGHFEPWSEDLTTDSLLSFEDHMQSQNVEEEKDPHIWLDPILAQNMVSQIKDRLIQINPSSAELYTTNANALTDKLQSLHESLDQGLKSCTRRDLIVTHDAFHYFADRYALEILPILNVHHADEPSLEELKELADYAENHGLTHIFVESLENPEVASVLAEEADLKILTLNPIEGRTEEERLAGANYFNLMESNLQNLKIAQECL